MDGLKQRINPIVFGLAALCFLLPFFKLSCGDMEFASVSGIQMVIGTTIDAGNPFQEQMESASNEEGQWSGGQQSMTVESSPLAIIALLACAIAFFMSFASSNSARVSRAILGAVGFVSLIALKFSIESKVTAEGQGIIQASAGMGFWLAAILLFAAFLVNIYREKESQQHFAKLSYPRTKVDASQP